MSYSQRGSVTSNAEFNVGDIIIAFPNTKYNRTSSEEYYCQIYLN